VGRKARRAGAASSDVRPVIVRTRSEARGTIVLYAAALLALVTAIVLGRVMAFVLIVLVVVIFLQSELIQWTRIRRPLYAARKAALPDDDLGYFLGLLKPYPLRESMRAFPPGPLIASVRLLRAESRPTRAATTQDRT
jgi:hypothetical protein